MMFLGNDAESSPQRRVSANYNSHIKELTLIQNCIHVSTLYEHMVIGGVNCIDAWGLHPWFSMVSKHYIVHTRVCKIRTQSIHDNLHALHCNESCNNNLLSAMVAECPVEDIGAFQE